MCQSYKIWKQITTIFAGLRPKKDCCLCAKVTKFESKSQRTILKDVKVNTVVYVPKLQNLKANHNSCLSCWHKIGLLFMCQSYKIWKQITTNSQHENANAWLLFMCQSYKIWKQITTETLHGIAPEDCCLCGKIIKFESKNKIIQKKVELTYSPG